MKDRIGEGLFRLWLWLVGSGTKAAASMVPTECLFMATARFGEEVSDAR